MAKKTSVKTKAAPSIRTATRQPADPLSALLFRVTAALLVIAPLIFSTGFYSIFVLPKFIALMLASALLLVSLGLLFGFAPQPLEYARALKSRHLLWAALYVTAITVSTTFGVSPRTSFFGSYENQMGLLTYIGFFIAFVALTVAVNRSQSRLEILLWAMLCTGTLTAAYALAQFFGKDPFLSVNAYLFPSSTGGVLRVPGTLGHANYLGNFLLYTTPVGANLALASCGRSRRLALVATLLGVVAIIISGTRGAWVGLVGGALAFVLLERPQMKMAKSAFTKRQMMRAAIVTSIALIVLAAILLSPPAQSVRARARTFVSDGLTGSGRTLLWRDALKAVPAYALRGCGPEGFRKAFLAYKSPDLARYAPQNNNESSHNIYLDAALSYGLAGAIIYIALLVSAFQLLRRAYRRAANPRLRLLVAGIFSSLVAVCVHNFFIYDQIATGLYFFAFMALALIAANLSEARQSSITEAASTSKTEQQETSQPAKTPVKSAFFLSSSLWHRLGQGLALVGSFAVLAAAWYAVSAVQTDRAMRQAFRASAAKDFDNLMRYGEQATQGVNPIHAYDYLFAQALSDYFGSVPRQSAATHLSTSGTTAKPWTLETVETAIRHAETSLTDTLTPESNSVLLANLALYAEDANRLRHYAEQAVEWDANFFSTRLMMAESLLADGKQAAAIKEAETAVRLNPASVEARSVLTRAHNNQPSRDSNQQEWVQRGRKAAKKGRFEKAEKFLRRALNESAAACPICHQLLAEVYEKTGNAQQAIAEWETMIRESPQQATTMDAASHIARLKQNLSLKK